MNSNLDLPMSKLTRRNFIKLLGRGGVIAGFAAMIGLPELPKTPKPKLEFSLDGEHWGKMRSTLPQVHDIFIDNEWLGPLKSMSWGMDGISRIVFKELPAQEISVGDIVKVWRNNEIALSGVVVDSDRGCVKFISSLKQRMLTDAGGFFYTKSKEVEFEMAYDGGF